MQTFIHPQAIQRAQTRLNQLREEIKTNPNLQLRLKIPMLFGGTDTHTMQAAIYLLTGQTIPTNQCTTKDIYNHITQQLIHETENPTNIQARTNLRVNTFSRS